MAVKEVRALRRGLDVLRALNRLKAATTLELARHTGVPRPTVHRLLETMEEIGLVTRSPTEETWNLTIMVRALSDGYDDESWVREVALPVVNRLQRQVIWPVDFTTFDRDTMIVRETTHRVSPFSIDPGMAGRRLPMLTTSCGRTYLAFCPPEEREAILERVLADQGTDGQIYDRSMINTIIEQTIQCGYGRRLDDYRPGTGSIAVPIFWEGRVLACLTIIWISSAMGHQLAVERLLGPLKDAAAQVEEGLRVFQYDL